MHSTATSAISQLSLESEFVILVVEVIVLAHRCKKMLYAHIFHVNVYGTWRLASKDARRTHAGSNAETSRAVERISRLRYFTSRKWTFLFTD